MEYVLLHIAPESFSDTVLTCMLLNRYVSVMFIESIQLIDSWNLDILSPGGGTGRRASFRC